MSEPVSNVSIGKVDLVAPAGDYNHFGSTNVINVNGHYNVEINAAGHNMNGVDLAAALEKLNAHIAAGCMHNSADRVDAPKCHEDTREAVQGDIFSWMSHDASGEVMWLTGPAGGGKSAIMGTICDKLRKTGQLAATFFFSSFAGPVERRSKRGFVTTLAYQLQQCEGLDSRVSVAILAAVQKDPAVFQMSLEEQMERLVLRPLRSAQGLGNADSISPMVIVVDGVDECGGECGRSRQDDQIEVLSVLFQATSDPAFPFSVIVASRPETWIRRFFTDIIPAKVTEVFLDDKYTPDDDIRLFLKSKFAELSRRYGYPPSTWPTPEDIEILVGNASGQFIYAATVIRWIETPGKLPRDQLDIVLRIKAQHTSSPFSVLDALYTSILKSSPSPEGTVLWLKAQQLVMHSGLEVSAWTVDRLFESSAGQARMLLALPSLVYMESERNPHTIPIDSSHYERWLKNSPSLISDVGWNSRYAFYHKSFLDYLGDHSRCGAAFPDIDDDEVRRWIWDRFNQTLKWGGPEVQVNPALLSIFRRCFLDLLAWTAPYLLHRLSTDKNILSECEPTVWLAVATELPPSRVIRCDPLRTMFVMVHQNCRFYRPCHPLCKRWRRAISGLPGDGWKRESWNPYSFLLDRFCIRRFKPQTDLEAE